MISIFAVGAGSDETADPSHSPGFTHRAIDSAPGPILGATGFAKAGDVLTSSLIVVAAVEVITRCNALSRGCTWPAASSSGAAADDAVGEAEA